MPSETSEKYIDRLLKQATEEVFKSVAEPLQVSGVVSLAYPKPEFGDYASNASLVLAKTLKKNPKELATEIIGHLKKSDVESRFSSIETAGGFINFKLSEKYLLSQLGEILERKDGFGSSDAGGNQKILVEYFQPNIAKPLHLGHLGTAIIGDCLFRLFQFVGFRPESDTHIGDWGTQFGILIWAYKNLGGKELLESYPNDRITPLNKLYVDANTLPEHKEEVLKGGKIEFIKLEQGDKENRELWKQFKDWSLQEFEIIYRELGIRKPDHDWPESFFEDKMPAVLRELKDKGLLFESQGAQIVDLSAYNLGTALVVKSDGGTTYLLRDLATYIFRKAQGFKKQLYVVDVRQSHALAQTFKVVELLGYIKKPGEAVHVAYGFTTLPDGAMSTRKGTIVNAEGFIKGVQEQALEIIEQKNPELPNKREVAKIVAAASIKYFNLSRNIKSDIVFDPNKAVSFEGNTGPYMQYTYARIHGILRKSKIQNPKSKINLKSEILNLKFEELSVLRKLNQFPEILEQAAKDYLPNLLCNYLFELSQSFNSFYQEIPVLQESDGQLRSFRLNLITATAQVIKNGLNLLGIEAPEEM